LAWAESDADRRAAAQFFARVVRADPTYISHGEIQWALSPDGVHWAPDLEARLEREFVGADAPALLIARLEGAIAGAASVSWIEDAPTPHGVLNDLAVAPEARRHGIARMLVAAVEQRAREREIGWMFLESGLGNEGAHRFFETEDYAPVSKVFAKRLTGE
tara:strand:+ start:3203 stop:3685 length:483 start_codon:yes stop_codon:yes gene_type:complete